MMISRVKSSVLYENRYCNQDQFHVAVFVGRKKIGCKSEIITIICLDFNVSVKTSLIPTKPHTRNTISIGPDIYVISSD